jgi:hypothetical protein
MEIPFTIDPTGDGFTSDADAVSAGRGGMMPGSVKAVAMKSEDWEKAIARKRIVRITELLTTRWRMRICTNVKIVKNDKT